MFSAVDDLAPIDGKPKRPNQDALLAQLGGPAADAPANALGLGGVAPAAKAAGGAMRGMFGFGGSGGHAAAKQLTGAIFGKPQQPSALDAGQAFAPSPDKAPQAGFAPDAPVDPQAGTPFANDARGFLTNSLQGIAGNVRGITGQGDDARKKYVEDHIRGLLPELEARGMKVGDVKGEKINVGGKWIDLMRDVANGQGGGAAEVQWLEEDPNAQAQAGPAPMGGVPLDPSLGGDPLAAIQQAIAGYANQKPNMQALLQQLGQ